MPDKKQLLNDFYGKYAPQEELTKERVDAIEKKYGNDNQRMLRDFYAKYAPQEELSNERFVAIENKYGLKKKTMQILRNHLERQVLRFQGQWIEAFRNVSLVLKVINRLLPKFRLRVLKR